MNDQKIEVITPPVVPLKETMPVKPSKEIATSVSVSGNLAFEQLRPFLSGKPLREPVRPKPQKRN
jgi:hypothetical protein